MTMDYPPHPGAFIWEAYLEPHGVSVRSLQHTHHLWGARKSY